MTKNKVLIPLDETEFTLQIVPYVFRYLAPEENELILLYLADRSSESSTDQAQRRSPLIHEDRSEASVRARFSQEIRPYTQALQRAGYAVSTQVDFRKPALVMQHWTQKERIDLVALATGEEPDNGACQVLQQAHVPIMRFHDEGKTRQQ